MTTTQEPYYASLRRHFPHFVEYKHKLGFKTRKTIHEWCFERFGAPALMNDLDQGNKKNKTWSMHRDFCAFATPEQAFEFKLRWG